MAHVSTGSAAAAPGRHPPASGRPPRVRFTEAERRTLLAGLFALRAARGDDDDPEIHALVRRLGGDTREPFFWCEPGPA